MIRGKDMYGHGDTAERTTLIIGASGGIGLEIALAEARAGASLVLHGRNPDRLKVAARLCAEANPALPSPNTVVKDLEDGEIGDELSAAASSCDALVVAFGPFVQKPIAETSLEDWRTMSLANLAVPGMLAGMAASAMAARGFGRILLFGGTRTETVRGFRVNAAYAAAKTGLGVLAKSLAAEFSGNGVSCAVLCPGFVETEYLSADSRRELASRAPRGRLISAADLAKTAEWLLSGAMDLCNGAIINADEGLYSL